MRLVVAGRKVQRIKRKSVAGQAVLGLIAIQIFFVSSFICVQLPTATGHNLLNFATVQAQSAVAQLPPMWQARVKASNPQLFMPVKKIRYDSYSPQVPVAIFLGYAFGVPIAPLAIALFILSGIIGPFFGTYLFASGGGLDYWTQPGFGYLLGMIGASFMVARITETRRTSLRQLFGMAVGTLVCHLIGIVYVLGCSLAYAFTGAGADSPTWLPWVFEQIRNLSWYPMPYDAIFGLGLIGLAFPIRGLVGLLTGPDIGLKSKADVMAQRQIEEILQY